MKNLLLVAFLVAAFSAKGQNDLMFNDMPYGQAANALVVDGNDVWVATGFGLVRYDKATGSKTYYTNFNEDALSDSGSYASIGVLALAMDSSHRLYVSTGKTVKRFDGTGWTTVFTLPSSHVIEMQYASNNVIWVKGVTYMSGSYYVWGRYDVTNDTLTMMANNQLNFLTNLFYWQHDGTYWMSQTMQSGVDSIRLVYFNTTSAVDTFYLPKYNPQAGGNLTVRGIYNIGSGKTAIITQEADQTNRLGVIENHTITYHDIPVNIKSGVRRSKYLIDADGNLYVLFRNDPSNPVYYYYVTDDAYLLKFDGSAVTAYDNADVGPGTHSFSDFAFDSDQNIWLTQTNTNDRLAANSLAMKSPDDQWTQQSLYPYHVPGNGNLYVLYSNALTVFDNTMQPLGTYEIADSIGQYSMLTSAAPNGDYWAYYRRSQPGVTPGSYRLARYHQGVVSQYTNLPYPVFDSLSVMSILAVNDGVYLTASYTDGGITYRTLHKFDGTNWTLLPTTNYPNGYYAYTLYGFDAVHGHLWYMLTSGSSSRIVKYDGTTNTVYNNMSITAMTQNGDKYFLKANTATAYYYDYDLWKWDANDSVYPCYLSPSFLLTQGTLKTGISGNAVYVRAKHNPANGEEYVMRFDGTSWSYYSLHPAMLDWMDDVYASLQVPDSNRFVVVQNNHIVSFQPSGLINLPYFNYNVTHGHVYYDLNDNNVFDSTDIAATGLSVNALPLFATLVNADGSYTLLTDGGVQHVTIGTSTYNANPASYTHDFGDSVGVQLFDRDFAIHPDTTTDLSVDLTTGVPFRPGFQGRYTLGYKNLQHFYFAGGTVRLVFDSHLSYQSAQPAPDFINGDTLVWNIGNLPFLQTEYIDVYLTTPTNVPIGTSLSSTAVIDPASTDVNPGNNVSTCTHIVTGSFDPNDKAVSSTGSNGTANSSDTLTYLIRFQNTGNDTAFTVTVRDTLSPYLDLSTFRLIASSHPVEIVFMNPNVVDFVFTNILLPDSTTNEPASHGFVKYSLQPKPGLTNDDVIHNMAKIYFDYNAAVATNTVSTPINNCATSPVSVFNNYALCGGDTFTLPNGNTVSAPGVYITSIPNSFGCDSLLITDTVAFVSLASNVTVDNETLTATSPADAYQWINCADNSPIAGATTAIYTAVAPGQYAVMLTAGNCSVTSACFNVVCVPQAVNQSVTLCNGDSVQIGTTWYSQSGTYTNALVASGGCDSIVTTTLSVTELDAGVTAMNQVLTATASGATYQWIDCNTNQPISGATNQSFTATADGWYAVNVSNGNCVVQSECLYVVITGNEENTDVHFNLFPNPSAGLVRVVTSDPTENETVAIKDLTGRTLLTTSVIGAGDIDLRRFVSGSYYVELRNNDKVRCVKKLTLIVD